MVDPIADMMTRIKNAAAVKKDTVKIPFSTMKMAVAELLEEHGFIGSFEKKGKKLTKVLDISLAYDKSGTSTIHDVQRLSKFSRRLYTPVKSIKPFKNGIGLVVLSTPKGVLTGAQAQKENVGGELMFSIW